MSASSEPLSGGKPENTAASCVGWREPWTVSVVARGAKRRQSDVKRLSLSLSYSLFLPPSQSLTHCEEWITSLSQIISASCITNSSTQLYMQR